MATRLLFLKITNGNVIVYNEGAQAVNHMYMKGDATRADWFDKDKGVVEVQTKGGTTLIINKECQIIRRV